MLPFEDREAPPAPMRRRGTKPLVLAVCLVWTVVAGAHLFAVWLWSNLGPLAWGVYGLVWLVAVVATLSVILALCLTRRLAWAAMALVTGVLGATTVVSADWNYAFVHGYYRLHRADFLAVAELSDSGRLGRDHGRLPAGLRHLALAGRPITHADLFPDATDVWLPAWSGLVDGMTGYAYIGDPPVGTTVNCLGDPCLVRWSLGDGWSWVEMPGWAMS